MPPTTTSEQFQALADVCEELDLYLLDDGGIFAPGDEALAEDLRDLAAVLAQVTTRAAQGLGVTLGDYPAVSVVSQGAEADGEAGLVVRMVSMVRSEDDRAWDAAARMDLPGAISGLAEGLRVLESSEPTQNDVADHLVDTAQHVCSLLMTVADLVDTAAASPGER